MDDGASDWMMNHHHIDLDQPVEDWTTEEWIAVVVLAVLAWMVLGCLCRLVQCVGGCLCSTSMLRWWWILLEATTTTLLRPARLLRLLR